MSWWEAGPGRGGRQRARHGRMRSRAEAAVRGGRWRAGEAAACRAWTDSARGHGVGVNRPVVRERGRRRHAGPSQQRVGEAAAGGMAVATGRAGDGVGVRE
jgi:hypothetical protein